MKNEKTLDTMTKREITSEVSRIFRARRTKG